MRESDTLNSMDVLLWLYVTSFEINSVYFASLTIIQLKIQKEIKQTEAGRPHICGKASSKTKKKTETKS